MAISEGKIPFLVDGATYETYFKLVGSLDNRTRTPLVVVHGGPAFAHNYLLPCADLAAHDIPVIFYDQLGSGRGCSPPNERTHDSQRARTESTVMSEWPPAFWSIDRMIDELENLLRHFDIENNFDLLGHSWGGVLNAEFAVRRKPRGLRHLVLASAMSSMALNNATWAKLLSAEDMPAGVKDGIAKGFADLPVFKAALFEFFAVHGCRVKPLPEDFVKGVEPGFVNLAPYFGM
jgi:proline-specific peptidase